LEILNWEIYRIDFFYADLYGNENKCLANSPITQLAMIFNAKKKFLAFKNDAITHRIARKNKG